MNEVHNTIARFIEAIDPAPYTRHLPLNDLKKGKAMNLYTVIIQNAYTTRTSGRHVRSFDTHEEAHTFAQHAAETLYAIDNPTSVYVMPHPDTYTDDEVMKVYVNDDTAEAINLTNDN